MSSPHLSIVKQQRHPGENVVSICFNGLWFVKSENHWKPETKILLFTWNIWKCPVSIFPDKPIHWIYCWMILTDIVYLWICVCSVCVRCTLDVSIDRSMDLSIDIHIHVHLVVHIYRDIYIYVCAYVHVLNKGVSIYIYTHMYVSKRHVGAKPHVHPHPKNTPKWYHILVIREWMKSVAVRSDFDFRFLGFRVFWVFGL